MSNDMVMYATLVPQEAALLVSMHFLSCLYETAHHARPIEASLKVAAHVSRWVTDNMVGTA